MELNLKRPLLFFDIESTGLDIPNASIVELSFVKVLPSHEKQVKTWRIKPWDYELRRQRPMESGASKVNGIKDEDLVACPTFYDLSPEIASYLKDSDLAGFNSTKFDLPMLAEEFERARLAGRDLGVDLHSPKMIDVQTIYHQMEPRNLRAAYRFYCGGDDFENAHTAEADTIATYEVLKGQLTRYEGDIPNDVDSIASRFTTKKTVDFDGHLIYNDSGEEVINFGKHKGKTAREVYFSEPSYFAWIQNGSFSLDTKKQFSLLKEKFDREKLAAKYKKSF